MRIVHIGLGNFFRAHQAWYTEHAPDADRWGIAAFGGRGGHLAATLSEQDCLYTLRIAGEPTRHEVISSISHAHTARAGDQWRMYLRSPQLAVVTLTVTEAASALTPGGQVDLNHEDLRNDIERLRAGSQPRTVPGRLADGLRARQAADGRPLAVVSCDNLAGNGARAKQVVTAVADAVDPALSRWIAANISWVSTVVDRITPATTADDIDAVTTESRRQDDVPVVTEAFTEWVLAGDFPAGRPEWDEVGAQFVEDTTPFENRKLWMLNGAHSLLAYAGGIRGHDTVAQAFDDPILQGWVDQWWDEVATHLALPPTEMTRYRAALRTRFSNQHIKHRLAQIAADGSQKLPPRIVPVARAERHAGRLPHGAARVPCRLVMPPARRRRAHARPRHRPTDPGKLRHHPGRRTNRPFATSTATWQRTPT
ncbi:mannitol dehydrogenase family protein [Phytohabitans kaempferiae]|uniref:Mannitol dehydrogenase family protein n=1 Tax=Phytohabitans kaempferiae TaxID=1620943 RepID=A0ABV6M3H0_9ACTN